MFKRCGPQSWYRRISITVGAQHHSDMVNGLFIYMVWNLWKERNQIILEWQFSSNSLAHCSTSGSSQPIILLWRPFGDKHLWLGLKFHSLFYWKTKFLPFALIEVLIPKLIVGTILSIRPSIYGKKKIPSTKGFWILYCSGTLGSVE